MLIMDNLKKEILYAFRILSRNPLFAIVAILTLALGIGANSAIFSAVYSLILKPLPYKDPEKLVFILSESKAHGYTSMSALDFQDMSNSGAFDSTAAYTTGTLDLTGKGEPERFKAAFVSWNYFQLLGVKPVYGRSFAAEEGKYGAQKVVVIAHSVWKQRFASDPGIVGSTVSFGGVPRTIVGIAPPWFDFPSETRIWGVLTFAPDELDPSQRGARWLRVIGRLAPDVSIEQAQQRSALIAAELAKKYPDPNEGVTSAIQPFHGFLIRKSKPALLVLWVAVGFVLLIACVNVTNLLLAQAGRRESEIAIRTALGAGRFRLFRQFVIESLVLATIASLAGLLIALWSTELLIRFGSASLPALAQVKLDSTVLFFTFIVSVLTGLLIGVIPAMQSVRGSMPQKLKSGTRIAGRNRIRRGLAIVEIATALVLLAGAGLLLKSFYRLIQVDPGFRTEGVLSFELSLPQTSYGKPHQVTAFYSDFLQRLKSFPEVTSSAAVFGLPMTKGYTAHTSFELTGKPELANEPRAGLRVVTPQYFQTMSIPIVNGRDFSESDTDTSGDVVIISEAAARTYWPNENPIGQKLRIHVGLVERKSTPRTIVGIVGDVHFEGLETGTKPDLYIPHAQQQLEDMMVIVRSSGDLKKIPTFIREELRRMNPNLPISNMKTMEEVVGGSLGERKFTMFLLSAFAMVGLFLAALGTYGVLSFQVVQRTQEIGVRLALGAKRSDVLRLILREGLFLAVSGTLIGLLGVLATNRFLESLIYGISTFDLATFVSVIFVIGSVALLACYLPALRATKVDPIVTLRYE
jgi:putative ABC transport system permease protein